MAPQRPLWRQVFDLADQAVTPRLESLVRTDHFARGVAYASKAQTFARDRAQGLSARLWHLVNLPAGTDLDRLRAQVGALDREVRRLTLQLERDRARRRASEETPDAVVAASDDPQPASADRSRPPRRRAQRPAGP